jgi:hypothetical protein
VWFVKMIGAISEWYVVCIGNGVDNEFVMVSERANGRCELWDLMKHDELGDMGCFVFIIKIGLLETQLQVGPTF